MLAQLAVTFSQLFRLVGACAIFIGVLFLLGAMLGAKGPDGYVKGGLFIFVGNWIARVAH